MQLDGKRDGAVLGETTDLDYFKQKLQSELNRGTPVDHPSLDKLHKQIALLEDAIVVYHCVRSPERHVIGVDLGNMPESKVRETMEQMCNQLKQKGQLNG